MIRLNSVFLSDFQDGNMSLHESLIEIFDTSVVNLTLLYINSEAVIPAKAGIQPKNTGFPRIKYGASLVKPGMTNKGKTFLNHYTSRKNLL
jgi:hypothetical protein